MVTPTPTPTLYPSDEACAALSLAFPSRITVKTPSGANLSAAALAAWIVSLLQRKAPGRGIVPLQIALGLAYSGGACGDLAGDIPTITKNLPDDESRETVAGIVRELVSDGYAAASGNLAAIG